MAVLSRSDVQQADDKKFEIVEVPEWGGSIRIRTMGGTERDQWELLASEATRTRKIKNKQGIRASLVALCCVDGDGQRIFTEADIVWLGEKSAKALDRVYDRAQELNKLNEDAIEETAKNLSEEPSEDSGSS